MRLMNTQLFRLIKIEILKKFKCNLVDRAFELIGSHLFLYLYFSCHIERLFSDSYLFLFINFLFMIIVISVLVWDKLHIISNFWSSFFFIIWDIDSYFQLAEYIFILINNRYLKYWDPLATIKDFDHFWLGNKTRSQWTWVIKWELQSTVAWNLFQIEYICPGCFQLIFIPYFCLEILTLIIKTYKWLVSGVPIWYFFYL